MKIVKIVFVMTAMAGLFGFQNADAQNAPRDEEVRRLLFPIETVVPENLKKFGPPVMPILADIYEKSDDRTKATIAWVMYNLAFKSADAKRVLMKDVHTSDAKLRLQVQWALGRVSGDEDVVETLLANMQNDDNPLFRDKAACALASDQIHLSEKQKYKLFEGLIRALKDSKQQVRDIAIKALAIQTGQTKGFKAESSESERTAKVKEWEKWLELYKSQL